MALKSKYTSSMLQKRCDFNMPSQICGNMNSKILLAVAIIISSANKEWVTEKSIPRKRNLWMRQEIRNSEIRWGERMKERGDQGSPFERGKEGVENSPFQETEIRVHVTSWSSQCDGKLMVVSIHLNLSKAFSMSSFMRKNCFLITFITFAKPILLEKGDRIRDDTASHECVLFDDRRKQRLKLVRQDTSNDLWLVESRKVKLSEWVRMGNPSLKWRKWL